MEPMQYYVIHPHAEIAELAAKRIQARLYQRVRLGHHPLTRYAYANHEPAPLAPQIHAIGKTLEEAVAEGFKADVIITPGNSYGDMTGGFDEAVVNVVGSSVQELIHLRIAQCFFGDMNVGQADLLPLPASSPFRAIAYAPTMRAPVQLPKNSEVPYLSMLAALQAIHRHNRHCGEYTSVVDALPSVGLLQSVVFTLHGRGTGNLPVNLIIRQTAMALEQVHFPQQRSIAYGTSFHRQLLQAMDPYAPLGMESAESSQP